MKVAILGGGAIGITYAAMLTRSGHDVVLWSETAGPLNDTIYVEGAFTFSGHIQQNPDLRKAVQNADVLICARGARGTQDLIDQLVPFITSGQTIIFSAELSLCSAYADQMLKSAGKQVPIMSWSTTVVTARRIAADRISCGTIRDRVDYAVTAARDPDDSHAVLAGLFNTEFHQLPSALAVALSNLNPPIHLANALANLTRIEKAENWENYAGITPSVGRVIEALDLERLALAAHFGLKVRTVFEHYLSTFPGITAGPVTAMASQVSSKGPPVPGPRSLDTRYLTEDIPFGLVPLVHIAGLVGVDMPLHKAGIRLASVYAGRDFGAENRMLGAVSSHLQLH